MSYLSQFIESARHQKGIKGKIKRKLFGGIYSALEVADKELSEKSSFLDDNAQRIRDEFEPTCVNVRNNNAIIERLTSENELMKAKIAGLEKKLKSAPAATVVQTEGAAPAAAAVASVSAESGSDYEDIDYFDFENHFRGSIESIKKSQEFYLKFFRDKKKVLDIGCGRGEFLSLMQDNGITAEGVDIYEPYVEYCNMKGLKASCGDGADFLAHTEGIDGIFVGQVVEHLKPHQIIQLCNTAYERLEEGGCIIIETPNPTSLSIYTNAFYIDPSHIKPVHPLTMQYYLEKAGFKDIGIIYTENSRPSFEIPELKCEGDTEEFNKAMKKVSEMLFGSQDYAVVATKKG
ncbi:MAG: class I SAM-dependent methyltransferase [Ruminococcus sp.]|uniref:class I SAM-dependent methyltransferase n=1 Tax=Ruminococcus sp. TaxID=41978 RepID=UPI0025E8249B|nr:class I SAM-dependent methyltransferase [Ruminococcus sp.]MCR4795893.1 class I SAM-dependent methyltransferase [Ruminococcus sp.]